MSSPKKLYLSRADDLTAFVSKDHPREELKGVHINGPKERIEATDAKIAVMLPLETGGSVRSTVLPAAPIKAALRTLPRRASSKARVCLEINEEVKIDGVNQEEFHGKYPDLDNVRSKYQPKARLKFSPYLLQKIIDYAISHGYGSKAIVFDFHEYDEPTEFHILLKDGRALTGLVVAMKPNDTDEGIGIPKPTKQQEELIFFVQAPKHRLQRKLNV